MAEPASVSPSSDPDVNALLTGYRWDTTNLTYSFPDSGWWYVLEEVVDDLDVLDVLEVLVDFITDPVGSLINILETALLGPFADSAIVAIVALNGFQEFNAAQQAAAEDALHNLESFTHLHFSGVDEGDFRIDYDDLTGLIPVGFEFTHGIIRYGETASTQAPAFGIPPLPRVELLIGPGVLGDTWYKNDGQFDNAVPGNFAAFTILHETGHAVGLKHAHEEGLFGGRIPEWLEDALTDISGPIISDAHNSLEFTAMTYVSRVGGAVGYTNAADSYPTTFMMYDILALQHMYGANFSFNDDDTTYSWNKDTGEWLINGVGQGTPAGNKVFMTIWDGNGIDTYDLSNYITDASIDLEPGKWSTTSQAQLAVLDDNNTTTSSDDILSRGTVFNSLLFNGDTRSLIENATGGLGNDTIKGNDVANLLRGNAGNDNIMGLLGADTLEGGDGNDTLDGGDGNDSLAGEGGNDSLNGGDGDDQIGGGDGNDSALGGAGIDTILAGAGNDHVEGGDGDDALQGEGGDDTVFGGNGIDTVSGGDGNDTIDGGADNDVLAGDLGNDSISGGDGDDTVTGGAGLDNLSGGAGDNSLQGGDDNDVIDGGDGNDSIDAGAGNDTVHGGAGNDNIDGGVGDDDLNGDDGVDTIFGRSGQDILRGGAGADSLDAGDGNDTASGGDGNDTILGGNGDDKLGGDGGDDLIHGGDGIDTINGGAGNDNLFGEAENDSLFGDEGDDTLAGGPGADLLNGGAGIDMASYSDATGPVTINLQDPTQTTGDAQGDILISIEQFGLSEFDDTFIGLDDPLSGDVVFGRGGDDTLLGFAGDDELHGEAGNDFIVGGEGADIVDGGAGFDTTSFLESNIGIVVDLTDPSRNTGIAEGDTIIDIEQFLMTNQNDEFVGSGVDETIYGNHGNDNISGGGGNDVIFGGEQHDVLSGDAGDDTIWGEAGNDIAIGGAGNDSLDGGLDIDDLRGGIGNDSIRGGSGDDRLNGGEGDDLMWGGEGRDVYAYAATNWGVDRIFDFEDKLDRIEFTGLASGPGVHAMDDLHIFERMGADGIETVIEHAAGGSDEIVLAGIHANQINHQDFIFLA